METFAHLSVNLYSSYCLADERLECAALEEISYIDDPQWIPEVRLIGTELEHCLLI